MHAGRQNKTKTAPKTNAYFFFKVPSEELNAETKEVKLAQPCRLLASPSFPVTQGRSILNSSARPLPALPCSLTSSRKASQCQKTKPYFLSRAPGTSHPSAAHHGLELVPSIVSSFRDWFLRRLPPQGQWLWQFPTEPTEPRALLSIQWSVPGKLHTS